MIDFPYQVGDKDTLVYHLRQKIKENLVLMLSGELTMKKGECQCNASWFCWHFGRENKRKVKGKSKGGRWLNIHPRNTFLMQLV